MYSRKSRLFSQRQNLARPTRSRRWHSPRASPSREIKPGIGYVRIAFFPGVNGQRFAREFDRALADISGCTTPDRRSSRQSRRLCRLASSHELLDARPRAGRLQPYQEGRRSQVATRPAGLHRQAAGDEARHDQNGGSVHGAPPRSLDPAHDRGLGAPSRSIGRIVMLVNEHTLSAGEMVAAFATENGLAKIVGTRTGGQVLGGGNFSGRPWLRAAFSSRRLVHMARLRSSKVGGGTGRRCASVVWKDFDRAKTTSLTLRSKRSKRCSPQRPLTQSDPSPHALSAIDPLGRCAAFTRRHSVSISSKVASPSRLPRAAQWLYSANNPRRIRRPRNRRSNLPAPRSPLRR